MDPSEETARVAAALRQAIERHSASLTEISRDRLGRAPDYLSKMLRGERTFRIDDLLLILAAIEVAPERFFAELYDLYRADEIGTVFGAGMFEGKLRRIVDDATWEAAREIAGKRKRRGGRDRGDDAAPARGRPRSTTGRGPRSKKTNGEEPKGDGTE